MNSSPRSMRLGPASFLSDVFLFFCFLWKAFVGATTIPGGIRPRVRFVNTDRQRCESGANTKFSKVKKVGVYKRQNAKKER